MDIFYFIFAFVVLCCTALTCDSIGYKKGRKDSEKDYEPLLKRRNKQLDAQDRIIFDLRSKVYDLEKENLKLKDEYVPRETFNKGYGTPEVVDWINAHYKEDSN